MTNSFSVRAIALIAAVTAAVIEAAIAWHEGMAGWLILPSAIAMAGTTIWAALAVDALGRRAARPDHRDLNELFAFQRDDHERLDETEAMLARMQTTLRLMTIEPALTRADHALSSASAKLEHWNAVNDDFVSWRDALVNWSSIVESFGAELSPETAPITDDEIRNARQRLPYDRNFSSQELKVALQYLVLSDRLTTARDRFAHYRTATLSSAAPTPVSFEA